MTASKLRKAHLLLGRYKEGRIPAERLATKEEMELVECLYRDLFPSSDYEVPEGSEAFRDLIDRILREDSRWNRALMVAMTQAYGLQDGGDLRGAEVVLDGFIAECPSSWYSGHAKAAKAEIHRGQRSK